METSKPDIQETPDLSRRRLATGGIAGVAVLGSLMSKPVLGTPLMNPPYHCTTSGQQSGNMSPRADENTLCTSLGRSPAQWLAASDWPGAITKGVLPSAPYANYPFPNIGTLFNSVLGSTSFRYRGDTAVAPGETRFNTGEPSRAASMLQVLAATTFNNALAFEFGQETVAAILNSYQTVGAYPLSTAQVIAMYNAVFTLGSYPVNSSTNWSRAQVLAYFKTLHP